MDWRIGFMLTAVLSDPWVRPPDHVVSPGQVESALAGHAAERAQDLARVESASAAGEAGGALPTTGTDAVRARAALSSLTDEELRRLAARIEALESNPTASGAARRTLAGALVLVALCYLLYFHGWSQM